MCGMSILLISTSDLDISLVEYSNSGCLNTYPFIMYVFLFIFFAERNIRNITNNFTLGFGTFVDKRTSPYVDVRENK